MVMESERVFANKAVSTMTHWTQNQRVSFPPHTHGDYFGPRYCPTAIPVNPTGLWLHSRNSSSLFAPQGHFRREGRHYLVWFQPVRPGT